MIQPNPDKTRPVPVTVPSLNDEDTEHRRRGDIGPPKGNSVARPSSFPLELLSIDGRYGDNAKLARSSQEKRLRFKLRPLHDSFPIEQASKKAKSFLHTDRL
jgi:hypothetical protein